MFEFVQLPVLCIRLDLVSQEKYLNFLYFQDSTKFPVDFPL